MSKLVLNNNVIIGDGYKPYIVAEMNSSHFGDIKLAKEMILAAKECGCNCVKFQSWSTESLYSKDYYKDNPIAKRIVKKLALSEDDLKICYDYCVEIGIDFTSTPYSNEEVDFLCEKVKVPFIKIASMEINNFPYLEYIAKKNLPIVLSTGMSSIDEVEKAVDVIRNAGNDKICILHCVSSYPVDNAYVNLNNIVMFKTTFSDLTVGYSDHTIGHAAACGAVALGACLVEKHFTLDNSRIGMDNNMATEPSDMKLLVDNCQAVYLALGESERKVSEDEMKQRENMRRSIIAIRDIHEGEIIKREDIGFKRPGTGISPDKCDDLVGRKANRLIESDTLIKYTDVL